MAADLDEPAHLVGPSRPYIVGMIVRGRTYDAQRLVAEYGSDSRDSIHVASALSRKVEALVSDDPDIDAVAEIKRLSSDSFRP